MKQYKNVADYIKSAPKETQPALKIFRQLAKENAPKAEETIKYGMPTYVMNGNLFHFAGFKQHVSLFPTPGPIEAFQKELTKYKTSKGTIQFELGEKLPVALIKKIMKMRVKENLAKAKKK